MLKFDAIAFDADDTLWHNENLFANAQAEFKKLLTRYLEPRWIDEHLHQTEMNNLKHFGYGIKAFSLSMIETAVELTRGKVSGSDIRLLIDLTKKMLNADVELLDQAANTLSRLQEQYCLLLITKGDLLDQEKKIARSGLAQYFRYTEIVSEKSPSSYSRILKRYAIEAGRFLMVGNSLRSDILPVLELGASAVYIPYALTWQHEVSQAPPAGQPRYFKIDHLGQLPGLLEKLNSKQQ